MALSKARKKLGNLQKQFHHCSYVKIWHKDLINEIEKYNYPEGSIDG
jgi:hypothetical protein